MLALVEVTHNANGGRDHVEYGEEENLQVNKVNIALTFNTLTLTINFSNFCVCLLCLPCFLIELLMRSSEINPTIRNKPPADK